jgi:hypothetical protein
VRDGDLDQGRVGSAEQGRERAAQGRPDIRGEDVVVGARVADPIERVPDAGGDAGARVGEGAVEIEEDGEGAHGSGRMRKTG